MAKKKSSSETFNLAAAIREVLSENRNLSGREFLDAVKQKHPHQTINKNSFNVSFYTARKGLGIKSGRRRKVVRMATPNAARKAPGKILNLELLQAARRMLATASDADTAVAAIQQVQALQLG